MSALSEHQPMRTAEAEDTTISLALYVRRYHRWSRWMLSADGIYARIERSKGRWCFVPHQRLFRWVARRRLPLEEAFPHGLRIRFLPSLKWRIAGSSLSGGMFAFILGKLGYERNVLDISDLEGWIESTVPRVDPAGFPVGEWLTVQSLDDGGRAIWLEDRSKVAWQMLSYALTVPTDIEVDAASIPKKI